VVPVSILNLSRTVQCSFILEVMKPVFLVTMFQVLCNFLFFLW
jgi:hypothetical protein